MRPVHLVHPGDQRTICGIGPSDNSRYPLMGTAHADGHLLTPGQGPCPTCWDSIGARPRGATAQPADGQLELFGGA